MPVYVQIQNQIRFAIASGRVKSGDALPSVRDLSTMLNVNSNTITKALRDLELKGLIISRRGIGIRVADGARRRCKAEVLDLVRRHLRDAVGQCAAAGLTDAQTRKIVSATLASGYQPYSG
jgi:GntR family transcriptional regulator